MRYTNKFDLDVASTIAFKNLKVNGEKVYRLGYQMTAGGNVRAGKYWAYYGDDEKCIGVTKEQLLDLARQNGIKYVSKGVKKNGEMTSYIVPKD